MPHWGDRFEFWNAGLYRRHGHLCQAFFHLNEGFRVSNFAILLWLGGLTYNSEQCISHTMLQCDIKSLESFILVLFNEFQMPLAYVQRAYYSAFMVLTHWFPTFFSHASFFTICQNVIHPFQYTPFQKMHSQNYGASRSEWCYYYSCFECAM